MAVESQTDLVVIFSEISRVLMTAFKRNSATD